MGNLKNNTFDLKKFRGIYFDVDHTLLDTNGIRSDVLKIVSNDLYQRGFSDVLNKLAVYESLERNAIESENFTMEQVSRNFADSVGLDQEEIWLNHKSGFENINFQVYIFQQVLELFVELKERRIPLGIWTQGDPWWQQLKLMKSGILSFMDLERVLIAQDKQVFLNQIPTGSLIVDDAIVNIRDAFISRPDIFITQVSRETGLTGYKVESLLNGWDYQ